MQINKKLRVIFYRFMISLISNDLRDPMRSELHIRFIRIAPISRFVHISFFLTIELNCLAEFSDITSIRNFPLLQNYNLQSN
jgi:hypothetical protein